MSITDLQTIIENAVPLASAAADRTAADYQYSGGDTDTTSLSKTKADANLKNIRAIRKKAAEARGNVDTSTEDGRRIAAHQAAQGPAAEEDEKLAELERDAVSAAADATVDNLRAQFTKVQASKPKEDAAGRIRDNIREIDKELATASISPDKRLALQTERAQAVVEANQQAQLDAMAASRAKFNVFDEVGQATSDRKDAERVLKENFTDKDITSGANYEAAKADVQRTRLEEAQTKTSRRFAKREAGAFGGDSVQDTKIALDKSKAELRDLEKYAKGSTAYYEKLGEVAKNRRAAAEANADMADLNNQLSTDSTNPVQVAQNALKKSKAKLKRDLGSNAPKKTIAEDRVQVESDTAKLDADAFSQRFGDMQHANDMGRLSNQAFLEYMTSERTRLRLRLSTAKLTDEQTRQAVEQLQSLDSSIKSAADSMQGQFNIGDIDIPTPYEVRRALKAKDPGNILGSNSSLSTGGNVTSDSSTKSVTLNGVPIQQVLAIIQDLFGTKARSAAKRRTP